MDHQSLLKNHPLAPHTTLKIGGPADYFCETRSNKELIDILTTTDIRPITILGNGSNVLISDSGIRGLVIKSSSNSIEFLNNHQIKVDAGVQLPQLLQITADHRLSGLEEFAYIPSSLGGAIVCNIHGVNKSNFDRFLVSIEVFDLSTSEVKTILPNQLQWSYDYSSLQEQKNLVILSAILQLQPGNTQQSKETISQIITKKTETQSMNSLGCVFKNPANDSAGRIIDQELGLKGFRLNDIEISPKHANFFVNLGKGTAKDYQQIINMVQQKAFEKLGINLETEIKLLGQF